LVVDDPDSLFKNISLQPDTKEDPTPFPDKVEDVPGPEILPQ